MKNIISIFKILLNFIRGTFRELQKRKFSLTLEFMLVLSSVLLAFYFQGIQNQIERNNITKVKINTMLIDMDYMQMDAYNLYNTYKDTVNLSSSVINLDESSMREIIKDENIHNVLPVYQVSIIRSAINSIYLFNLLHQKYAVYYSEKNYILDSNALLMRRSLKDLSVSVLSHIYLLRNQLNEFAVDENIYKSKIKIFEDSLKIIERRILEGKLKYELN